MPLSNIPFGIEVGIIYTLTGPGGTIITFNDPDDVNFVGFIEEITGLDGPDVRESAELYVQGDGGIHSDFFFGRRPITISGLIDPNTVGTNRNIMIKNLLEATNAMKEDATLTWTASGGVPVAVKVRRQNSPRISGGRIKAFQISLIAADPRIYGTTINNAQVNAGGSATGGFTSPIISPWQSGASPVGQLILANLGNISSPPTIAIYGPITNPVVRNQTTGEELSFTYSLTAGEFLEINTADRTISLNGSTNRYSALNFTGSSWWELQPGNNDIRLSAASYSTGAYVSVLWNHAWT